MTASPLAPHVELSPTWHTLLAAASGAAPPDALVGNSPRPFPHARKKPDITLAMLLALKLAVTDNVGLVCAPHNICRALLNRDLVKRYKSGRLPARYFLSANGRLLIETQYDALLKILTNDLTAGG